MLTQQLTSNYQLLRDGSKTPFVAIFLIFERDKEDEPKDRKCSSSYIEDLLVKSDAVAVKNQELQQKGVLEPSLTLLLVVNG